MNNMTNTARDLVLAAMAKGRVSPNSKIMWQYKQSLPMLTPYQQQACTGLMLGDVSLVPNKAGTSHSIKFEWGDINYGYAKHVFSLLELFCLTPLRKQTRINANGNAVVTWCFQTVSVPAFNFLADLFIVDGKKVINTTLLAPYLTDVALAYWFMDDGSVSSTPDRYGLSLHTQGFTPTEVDALIDLLVTKFGLDCWRRTNKGLPMITISGHSYAVFFALVSPYIHESMRRKFPTGNRTVWPSTGDT